MSARTAVSLEIQLFILNILLAALMLDDASGGHLILYMRRGRIRALGGGFFEALEGLYLKLWIAWIPGIHEMSRCSWTPGISGIS